MSHQRENSTKFLLIQGKVRGFFQGKWFWFTVVLIQGAFRENSREIGFEKSATVVPENHLKGNLKRARKFQVAVSLGENGPERGV